MLNKKQQEAFKAVVNGNEQIVILTGAGGTGKSHTTAEIIKAFKGTVALTATTHKARENISHMAQEEAFTTQSYMGFRMVKQGYEMNLIQTGPIANPCALLIVDETSMLPKNVYKAIIKNLGNTIHKVLFLGDDIQLEAVGEGITLDDIPGYHIELTEQMRQKDVHPEVTRYLAELRDLIKQNKGVEDMPLMPKNCDDFVNLTNYRDFAELYVATTGDKKCIAYRNTVVNKMNNYIVGNETYNIGDEVVLDAPIGKKVKNGAVVQIWEVKEDPKFDRENVTVIADDGNQYTLHHWHSKAAFAKEIKKARHIHDEDHFWYLTERNVGMKHRYAVTCYKSQGSSYGTVFIDFTDLWKAHDQAPTQWNNPITFNSFARMVYVALSRMRNKAVVFTGDLRKYQFLGAT